METITQTPNLVARVTEGLEQCGIYLPPEAVEYLEAMEKGETDGITCWRSDLVERRPGSKIQGRGLFAKAELPNGVIVPGELLAIKPGRLLTNQEVKDLEETIQGSHQQIARDVNLAGATKKEVDKNLVGYNHSCDPNAWVIVLDGIPLAFLVNHKPILAEDEITVDYSACYDSQTAKIFECNCRSPKCRGVIRPRWDWMNPAVQRANEGRFPAYLQRQIDEFDALPEEEQEIRRQASPFSMGAEIVKFLADKVQERQKLLQRIRSLPSLSARGQRTKVGRMLLEYSRLRPAALAKLEADLAEYQGLLDRYVEAWSQLPLFDANTPEERSAKVIDFCRDWVKRVD